MKQDILMNSSLYGYWSSWPSSFFNRQWFWDAEITQTAWSVTVEWRGCFLSLFTWSCSTVIIILFNVSGSFHYQSAGIMGCKLWLQGSGWAKRKCNDPVFLQELIGVMYLKASPRTEAQTRNWRILPTAACAPPGYSVFWHYPVHKGSRFLARAATLTTLARAQCCSEAQSLSLQLKGRGSADILKTQRESQEKNEFFFSLGPGGRVKIISRFLYICQRFFLLYDFNFNMKTEICFGSFIMFEFS